MQQQEIHESKIEKGNIAIPHQVNSGAIQGNIQGSEENNRSEQFDIIKVTFQLELDDKSMYKDLDYVHKDFKYFQKIKKECTFQIIQDDCRMKLGSRFENLEIYYIEDFRQHSKIKIEFDHLDEKQKSDHISKLIEGKAITIRLRGKLKKN